VDSEVESLLACIGDAEAPFDARFEAGEKLGRLGDPRIDGVLVPLGGFALGRHLVTVAEYAELIAAGGYDDASWWSTEGWRWREENDVDAPRFWDDPQWKPYLVPNHPVVGVSAFEAEAYCTFRDARLPSVGEWERAFAGRAYPWGDDWIPDACGQRDHPPRSTRPIGIYPRGVASFGHHDLVGHVWQWTADEGAGGRLVCGGGWNNLPWSIGRKSRNAFPPGARFSNLGFRCAG
jgi:formylglycine-generating enzyme required for sulfatase activity